MTRKRLSNDSAEAILFLRKTGNNVSEIARMTGYGQSTVSQLVKAGSYQKYLEYFRSRNRQDQILEQSPAVPLSAYAPTIEGETLTEIRELNRNLRVLSSHIASLLIREERKGLSKYFNL